MNNILTIFSSFSLQDRTFVLCFAVVLLLVFILIFFLGRWTIRIQFSQKEKEIRADAIKKSRAVLQGLTNEQIAPFLPNFPCEASDCRFIGKPIDFVAFTGAPNQETITEILFIEVKSGSATLTKKEKSIKDVIKNGKVRFVEYRTP